VHAGELFGFGDVDRDDARVRVGAAQDGSDEQPRQAYVVGVDGLARDLQRRVELR